MASQVPPRTSGGRKPPQRPSNQRSGSQRPGTPRASAPKQGKQATFRAQKRRQQRYLAIGAVVVVVAVILVIVGIKAGGGGGSSSGEDTRTAVSSTALNEVLSVTPAEMKTAASNIKLASYPFSITTTSARSGKSGIQLAADSLKLAAPLTAGGKPEFLYVGAEYCPYCAGERWAVVMALSQFGHFTNLHSVTSEPQDTVASVPTFTFYGSTYTSPYLTFQPVEQETVSGKTLQTPTSAEEALLTKYDGPPYVSQGGIPFLDLGGRYIQDGINYDDSALQHQKFDAVAAQIGAQSTPVAGKIAATAGVLVSRLCQLTGGKSLNDDLACRTFPNIVNGTASA